MDVLTNIRQLTVKDVNEIERCIFTECADNEFLMCAANIDHENVTDLDFILAGEYSDEDLISADYIIGEVTIAGVMYHFIHGFPGDEPCGVLYTPDFSRIVGLHWSMDYGDDPLSNWYLDSLVPDEDGTLQPPTAWFIRSEE
jgi:hypothetical protein